MVSVPPEELPDLHKDFVQALGPKLGVRYLQLTDRKRGQLPTPEGRVAMDVDSARVLSAFAGREALVYGDGRHQLWVRGSLGETVILDENGVMFLSPDDPSFRDLLRERGISESQSQTLEKRDYVRVNFLTEADAQEASLWDELNMLRWR